MIAEIIAIGNEVVDGTVINTNASWLSQKLSEIGISVVFHTAIPDDEDLMLEAFNQASKRAQVVLVTGGLGPTVDDFTLEVAAKYFDKKLVLDPESLEKITQAMERLGRPLTPNQEKQAYLPEDFTVLRNTRGTAPGAYYFVDGVHYAFFPGVPSEMKKMFQEGIRELLLADPGRKGLRLLKTLHCFGLAEGEMDHSIQEDLTERLNLLGAQLGFRVRFPTIDIRLSVSGKAKGEAEEILERAAKSVRDHLGKYIFGEDGQTLPQVVGTLLREKGKTLATAESCTGGLVANWVTDVPGASDYFLEGVVCYTNEAKTKRLGVSQKILEQHGAVSSETAIAMAQGIQKLSGADFGIGTTGIAGPSGGSASRPVGTVHVAVVHAGGTWERRFLFPFGRERFKELVAATALDRVRRFLI